MTKHARSSRQTKELTTLNEALLTALENERRYVARELHDGVAQSALQLGLQAGICRKLLERGMLERLAQELADLEARIHLASAQVREIIADMRPPLLDSDATLVEFLQHAIEVHQERSGPPVEFHVHLSHPLPDLPRLQKLTITRLVQEALLNIRKHAQASMVTLHLTDDERHIYLTMTDNGKGFEVAEAEARPVDRGGAGLANLRARAQALGGIIKTQSRTAVAGTRLKVALPKR
jgi:two-component system sensor histidine kinase DegS